MRKFTEYVKHLNMHNEVAHRISFSSKTFDCLMCSNMFQISTDIEEHIESTHNQESDICN